MDARSNNLMVSANSPYGFGSLARSGGVFTHKGNKAKINLLITDTDTPTVLKMTIQTKRAKRIRVISYLNGTIVDVMVRGLI